MTELRTEGGGRSLTRRADKVVNKQQRVDVTGETVRGADGWWIYAFEDLVGKFAFNGASKRLEKIKLGEMANGLAFVEEAFAEGAERLVYRCTEIRVPGEEAQKWYYDGIERERKDLLLGQRKGLRLVAKEAKDQENWVLGCDFHTTFARVQYDARLLALQFNSKCSSVFRRQEWNVNFLQTHIYHCYDRNYPKEQAWVLVEPELDGKFTKWNNNAGAGTAPPHAHAHATCICM